MYLYVIVCVYMCLTSLCVFNLRLVDF